MNLTRQLIAGVAVAMAANSAAHAQTFNGGAISIPAIGPANPYPSVINVSGVSGTITTMSVTITGFTHSFADDLGMLLVGPNGHALILADGAGDGPADNLTWTFTDAATEMLPMSGPLGSGTFKPGLNQYGDVFTAPVPAPDAWFTTFASAFGGIGANGAWNLYVEDFVDGDGGSIASWSITFGVPAPSALVTLVAGGAIIGPRRRRNP